ncbi:hydroxymethylglutaryl-CoA synthase [Nocardia pseudobrasiliensis]|uniref:Hydroxymethylglutaryl-CoA synthase n=1 Tax=Nocardia pseudobrasiliensis TaxID=45979 RepID=A0A370HK05_9NOCA|nr:hydroxymethylglutaryl-CoA synthase [Nocardia pseudobrasiliensis]RDI58933.1 hydroxymethylglutaryl-CoA synthase [Nocardia pseudobrasiliensis]
MPTPVIGIHDLSIATTHYVLDHATLAHHHGVPVDKYHYGIGQEAMSVPAADEDIVTLAATAAAPILQRHGTDNLRTLLLATESSVDQSKASGLYLHPLLGLPNTCRVLELKQACYSATAALQLALGLITRDPAERVLVIAADIARYDLDTPAEATQGAAAAAMLITADPALAALGPITGIHSTDVNDFWRPNYRTTAVVDGKLSITAYLDAVTHAYTDYRNRGGLPLEEFAAFCYHQPFTKMAYKAHRHLLAAHDLPTETTDLDRALAATTHYNRVIGNSYTASLYLALASLLDHTDDLTGQPIAMISYGSGSVAELFTATPAPGYQTQLRTTTDIINQRKPIDYHHYRTLHTTSEPTRDGHLVLPRETASPYRLAAITNHNRIYETTGHPPTA